LAELRICRNVTKTCFSLASTLNLGLLPETLLRSVERAMIRS
jgi:hypothetical protein